MKPGTVSSLSRWWSLVLLDCIFVLSCVVLSTTGANTCQKIKVANFLPGTYTNSTIYNGRPIFYTTERDFVLFFAESRQRSSSTLTSETVEYVAGDAEFIDHLHLELDEQSYLLEGVGVSNGCMTGGWYARPLTVSGRLDYPVYGVADCAYHPADIPEDAAWIQFSCSECNSFPTHTPMSIACDAMETALPTTSTAATTSSPNPREQVAPTSRHLLSSSSGSSSSNSSENCTILSIVGSPDNFEGVYTESTAVRSEDRSVFIDPEGLHTLIFLVLDGNSTRLPERRLFGEMGRDDNEGWSHEEDQEGTAGLTAAEEGELLRRLKVSASSFVSGRVSVGEGMETVGASALSDLGTASFCLDGNWLIFSFDVVSQEPSYPVLVTLDCALHPLQITSVWFFVDCEGCEPEEIDSPVVSCADDTTGAVFTPSPTSVTQAPTLVVARTRAPVSLFDDDGIDRTSSPTSSGLTKEEENPQGGNGSDGGIAPRTLAIIGICCGAAALVVMVGIAAVLVKRKKSESQGSADEVLSNTTPMRIVSQPTTMDVTSVSTPSKRPSLGQKPPSYERLFPA